jgi:hypothetical protein
MAAHLDLLLEASHARLSHDDHIRILRELRGSMEQVKIALRPGVDDIGHIGRVAAAA